jgi:hypothetical protein
MQFPVQTYDANQLTKPRSLRPIRYIDVVMQASQNYGPNLHVFLACGPMSETYCAPVQQVLAAVTAKGVKAHFLDQRGFLNGTLGCCGHPDMEVASNMAESGAAFIKAALGWS